MALKIDITDGKGVKTRYHKIKSFTYFDGRLSVRLTSYVNQSTRDAEKTAIDETAEAVKYDATTEELRTELDQLSSQLSPNGEGDEATIERIKELTNTVNDRVADPNRPRYTNVVDKFYDETDVELPYFEPITLEAIYAKLAVEGRYEGAESI